MSFNRRAILYNDFVDFETILQKKMSEKYIERVQDEKAEDMLIMSKIPDLVSLLIC